MTKQKSEKKGMHPSLLKRINRNAAGIDCGAEAHYIAVPPERDTEPVRSFKTFTADLHRLDDAARSARSRVSRWNQPVCTGSRSSRSSKSVASRPSRDRDMLTIGVKSDGHDATRSVRRCKCLTMRSLPWWAHPDSNQGPTDYESDGQQTRHDRASCRLLRFQPGVGTCCKDMPVSDRHPGRTRPKAAPEVGGVPHFGPAWAIGHYRAAIYRPT